MGDDSKIEWTDATWNPVTGCSHVSPGCEHCYAETLSLRYGWTKQPWGAQHAVENVVLHPERLDQPLRWKKPRRIFVNSMSDLFHERVPFEFIGDVFTTMALADRHTFQVLTKRPERMLEWFAWTDSYERKGFGGWLEGWRQHSPWPLPNVWLGVSVEDQRRANERIPLLLGTPAIVRFLSAEPLLGPVFFTRIDKIDWVIVGGESGPQHRDMDPEWLMDIVFQCRISQVPLFVKQDSGPRAGMKGRIPDDLWIKEYPA